MTPVKFAQRVCEVYIVMGVILIATILTIQYNERTKETLTDESRDILQQIGDSMDRRAQAAQEARDLQPFKKSCYDKWTLSPRDQILRVNAILGTPNEPDPRLQ
jgi:hypothetical protein